jgi:ketosteroid isomerase-like protein
MFFVNDNLVYEIGQCKGTYKGKYILVWKKESDGVWRVFIDSNI